MKCRTEYSTEQCSTVQYRAYRTSVLEQSIKHSKERFLLYCFIKHSKERFLLYCSALFCKKGLSKRQGLTGTGTRNKEQEQRNRNKDRNKNRNKNRNRKKNRNRNRNRNKNKKAAYRAK